MGGSVWPCVCLKSTVEASQEPGEANAFSPAAMTRPGLWHATDSCAATALPQPQCTCLVMMLNRHVPCGLCEAPATELSVAYVRPSSAHKHSCFRAAPDLQMCVYYWLDAEMPKLDSVVTLCMPTWPDVIACIRIFLCQHPATCQLGSRKASGHVR